MRGGHVLAAGAALSLCLAGPALAWKPKTHVYLAEEAMRDALADGKVTLGEIDPQTGELVGTLGAFEVEPKALAALKGGAKQFRAGVLGPDAYPDILTGQQIIHPDESAAGGGGASGSDAWLSWIHRKGFVESGDAKVNAFALGYLTHAAGDVFAHTYVNHYAGGEFTLDPAMNAVKHLTLEGYIGERTPRTVNAFSTRIASGRPCDRRKQDDLPDDGTPCGIRYESVYLPVTSEDTSIAGVEAFIWREMIDARPGSELATRLYRGEATGRSIPWIFSRLRTRVQARVDAYEAKRATLSGLERAAFEATSGPGAAYDRAWVEDIDRGLQAWPATSHEVAKALVFSDAGADLDRAETAMGLYVRDHMLSMAGAPDGVVQVSAAVIETISKLMPEVFVGVLEEILRAPLNATVEGATGQTLDKWKDYLSRPHAHFDDVMGQGGGGHGGAQAHTVNLSDFNREQLKIDDAGYANAALRWETERFAPAFNTLQMTKLLLLSDKGRRELEQALTGRGALVALGSDNLMLGWVRSMDAGNQWQALPSKQPGASPQPTLAQSGGAAWRRLFMRQLGEEPLAQEPAREPETPAPQEPQGPGTPAPQEPAPPQQPEAPPPKPPAPQPPRPDPTGTFKRLGAWSVRIDRVERPADDRLVHVYLTLRNDGPRRLLQTQDVSVVHRDSMGISAESSQSLKPQTGRPELFGAPQPVALPGRELRAKYVFDRNGATTGITVREGADYSAEFGF
ncbi:zinc dependent phospholipase C family protein [Phenylobacterium sp. LjRoot164]|uniref:zinc dependent phospholipase C family protein n=1 Tax=unclassified Phenylobacterium TaxID=2640670 RepID=UPI003ECFEEA5